MLVNNPLLLRLAPFSQTVFLFRCLLTPGRAYWGMVERTSWPVRRTCSHWELPRMLRKLDNFDLLMIDDLGYLPQGAEESEVLFTLIADRYERRSPGVTSNPVFSEWEKVFANPMATAAA